MMQNTFNNTYLETGFVADAIAQVASVFPHEAFGVLRPVVRVSMGEGVNTPARVRVYSRRATRLPDGRLMGGSVMIAIVLPPEHEQGVYVRADGRKVVASNAGEMLVMLTAYGLRRARQLREGWLSGGINEWAEADADGAAERAMRAYRLDTLRKEAA